jgi:hypothetical protein
MSKITDSQNHGKNETSVRYKWDPLNKQQVGAFAEYFVKMEFTMHGFQVYSTEVDDRGVDFVVRYREQDFLSIQVKSIRILKNKYVLVKKDKFKLSKNLILALAILIEGSEPKLYLIPSLAWKSPNDLFKDKNYENLKSNPE